MQAPGRVTAAGDDFLTDSDPIKGWLDAHVRAAPGGKAVPMAEMHRSYSAWATSQGIHPVASPTLGKMLKSREYETTMIHGRSHVLHVTVTVPATPAEEAAVEVGRGIPKTFPRPRGREKFGENVYQPHPQCDFNGLEEGEL